MRDFSGWRYYTDSIKNIGIISPDRLESRLLVDEEVVKWLATGGIPLPAV